MVRIEDEPLIAAVLSAFPGTIIRTPREGLAVVDPTENEKAALQAASDMGGEFLDALKKTDLDTITVEEWHQFVECIVTGFQDRLRELVDNNRHLVS